jgi:hypothetical protein
MLWAGLAMAAGATLGVGARVAMRLVALEAGVGASFSAGGSLEVVLFGALVGAPVALGVWACRWRFHLPDGTGVTAGVLLFAAMAAWQPPAARSALGATPDAPLATAALFAAAFLVYGLSLDAFWRVALRGSPP